MLDAIDWQDSVLSIYHPRATLHENENGGGAR